MWPLAGRYNNPIPTRFLAPIDCSKISALETRILFIYLYVKKSRIVKCSPQRRKTKIEGKRQAGSCSACVGRRCREFSLCLRKGVSFLSTLPPIAVQGCRWKGYSCYCRPPRWDSPSPCRWISNTSAHSKSFSSVAATFIIMNSFWTANNSQVLFLKKWCKNITMMYSPFAPLWSMYIIDIHKSCWVKIFLKKRLKRYFSRLKNISGP